MESTEGKASMWGKCREQHKSPLGGRRKNYDAQRCPRGEKVKNRQKVIWDVPDPSLLKPDGGCLSEDQSRTKLCVISRRSRS